MQLVRKGQARFIASIGQEDEDEDEDEVQEAGDEDEVQEAGNDDEDEDQEDEDEDEVQEAGNDEDEDQEDDDEDEDQEDEDEDEVQEAGNDENEDEYEVEEDEVEVEDDDDDDKDYPEFEWERSSRVGNQNGSVDFTFTRDMVPFCRVRTTREQTTFNVFCMYPVKIGGYLGEVEGRRRPKPPGESDMNYVRFDKRDSTWYSGKHALTSTTGTVCPLGLIPRPATAKEVPNVLLQNGIYTALRSLELNAELIVSTPDEDWEGLGPSRKRARIR